jgi:hypothetical protein
MRAKLPHQSLLPNAGTPTRFMADYWKNRDVNHPRFSISILAPSMKFSGPCSIRTTQQKVAIAKNASQSTKRKYRTRRYYLSAVWIARDSASSPVRRHSKIENDDEDVNESDHTKANLEHRTLMLFRGQDIRISA